MWRIICHFKCLLLTALTAFFCAFSFRIRVSDEKFCFFDTQMRMNETPNILSWLAHFLRTWCNVYTRVLQIFSLENRVRGEKKTKCCRANRDIFTYQKHNWSETATTITTTAKIGVFRCRLFLSAQNLTLTHIKFIFCAQLLNLFFPSSDRCSSSEFDVVGTFRTGSPIRMWVRHCNEDTPVQYPFYWDTIRLEEKSHNLIPTFFLLLRFLLFCLSFPSA